MVDLNLIWLILLTLLGSAFFSGSETALISVNKVKMQSWLEEDNRLGRLAAKFISSPSDILSSLLVGNNLMNVIATVLIADLIFQMFPQRRELSILISALIIPAVTTPPILFFGEIIPKSMAREHAGRTIRLVTTPLLLAHYILTPIAWITRRISSRLLKLAGVSDQHREEIFTRKNIQRVLIESGRNGVLDEEERNFISGVFNFSEITVREVMTPRTEIVAVPKDTPAEEIAATMSRSKYSRIPIYEESLDHITGIVHVVDLLGGAEHGQPILHPVILSPETRKADSLFYEMRHRKCHLAVVLDEYGGTAGIVTLEDLLEELVGDIHDVHDNTGTLVKIGRDNSIFVDGRTRFDELKDKISLPDFSHGVETIGGLLIAELGRIPEPGERFQIGNLRITVLEATPKRVERLRISQLDSPQSGDQDGDDDGIMTIDSDDHPD
ncbi:MAG: HlyC/CorC family transporter [Candidatus Glassbacteria bacterium]|nr:HlyC/CorC family transporter [Candidatus Glassbacteria bacterium]